MATTTNFGWETPDDTDLVKDGALAMRTLGNSIDSSFVDLKGGTTGQVLAKASNTDLDYTWVTQDDANAIQNAIVDAKGDLIAASAADTPARLAVGNNGETLVADSSTSTGLRWQADWNTGKNKIINGDFAIWQRGTSFSNIFGVYTADRYISGFGLGGTQSISQQDVTGATGLPNFIRYAMRYATTSAATNQYNVTQRIEDVQTLAGQTVTFSFYARRVSGTGTALRLNAYQIFGTGGSTFTQPVNDLDFTVTNSDFQRFSHTFTMPSMAGKTIGTNSYLDFRIAYPTAVSTFDVTGWQLEAGSVATPFTTATGTLAGELAACQRYAQTVPWFGLVGRCESTTAASLFTTLPVVMRVAPSFTANTGTLTNYIVIPGVGYFTPSAVGLVSANPSGVWMSATATGLTSGTTVAGTASFGLLSAEL